MGKSIELNKYDIHPVLSSDNAGDFGKLESKLMITKDYLNYAIENADLTPYGKRQIKYVIQRIEEAEELTKNLFNSLNYCVSAL